MYTQDFDVLSDKGRIKVPLVYSPATYTDTKHDTRPITKQEFIQKQAKHFYCQPLFPTVGTAWINVQLRQELILDLNCMCRWSCTTNHSFVTTAGSIISLELSRVGGTPGERRMYHTIRCEYYWPHMANDVHTTMRDCCECARNQPSQELRRALHLSSESKSSEFVPFDNLEPLPKTVSGDSLYCSSRLVTRN